MSTRRTAPTASGNPPVGPDGRSLCRRCREPVPRGRKTFCGAACVHEWKIRTNPTYAADCVERRDQGVCAICGVDTVELYRWRRYCLSGYRSEGIVLSGWPPERQHHRVWTVQSEGAFMVRLGTEADIQWCDPAVDDATKRDIILWLRITDQYMRGREIVPTGRLWDMDHTVPVIEGGGEVGLDGLRTLCVPCHRHVTRELRARLAEARHGA